MADDQEIFFDALELESSFDRQLFLERVCGSDLTRKRHIETLLAIHDSINVEVPIGTTSSSADSLFSIESQAAIEIAEGLLEPSHFKHSHGRLGRYEILGIIGVGGTCSVVEGYDAELSRIVAIKVMSPALSLNLKSRKRFQREARVAATIDCSNIVKVYSVGQQENTPYLVMEFVRGQTLSQLIRQEQYLSVDQALSIGKQITRGLSVIHEHQLLHRDIKPENIFLENSGDTAKISDFGIARAVDDFRLTHTGEVVGTPQFMSPEQAQCLPVDERSDLFSLGVVLYAMLSSNSPFEASSPLASMRRVCDDNPRPLRELNLDVPKWLSEIISQLLEKAPENRIQSAHELMKLLEKEHLARRDPKLKASRSQIRSQIIRNSFRQVGVLGIALAGIVVASIALLNSESSIYSSTLDRFFHGTASLHVQTSDPDTVWTISKEGETIEHTGPISQLIAPGYYSIGVCRNGNHYAVEDVLVGNWQEVQLLVDAEKLTVDAQE